MSDEWADLYAAADSATQYPNRDTHWMVDPDSSGIVLAPKDVSGWDGIAIARCDRDRDARFIAAANPSVVKALIDRIEELEGRTCTPECGYFDAWLKTTDRLTELESGIKALAEDMSHPPAALPSFPMTSLALLLALLNATDKDAQPVRGDGYHCDRCRAEERS